MRLVCKIIGGKFAREIEWEILGERLHGRFCTGDWYRSVGRRNDAIAWSS